MFFIGVETTNQNRFRIWHYFRKKSWETAETSSTFKGWKRQMWCVGAALRFSGTHMPWMKPFIMKCVFCMVFFFQCCCVVLEASIFSKSSCVALTFFKNIYIRFRNQRMCFHHCFSHLSQSKNIGRVADFVDCILATKFTMCPKYCGHWVPCKMKNCSKLAANTN